MSITKENFGPLGLSPQYIKALEDLGFEQPTGIQEKAIPLIRGGQHLIGIAQTGTGKTAAYLLPSLQKLQYHQPDFIRAIIMVPTKELVLQVLEQQQELAKYTDIKMVGLYGGLGWQKQAKQLEAGTDMVVCTPRRLFELYERMNLDLRKVEILILDEADRMLDMGFRPQINTLLDLLPRKKQNLLFSATFSPEVEELSWNFMDFPHKVEITPEATPVETVEQRLYYTPNFGTKINLLVQLFQKEEGFDRVIIFVRSKRSANKVFEALQRARLEGEMRLIHSNKGQNSRINAFKEFKEGLLRILVSTDVMARGIDIPEVSHVINFEVPRLHEDYVHRIGRTGRAFRTGTAISFAQAAEQYHIQKIQKKIRMAIPVYELPANLNIPETPFDEKQEMAKEIDHQKRKEDPNFQGAFHEKKDYKQKQKQKSSKRKRQFNGKAKSYIQKTTPKKKTTSKRNRHKK